MELDINRISNIKPVQITNQGEKGSSEPPQEEKTGAPRPDFRPPPAQGPVLDNKQKVELEQYIKEILNVSYAFQRKLKFIIDEKLDQVVVKVIDSETDKVIREIPPQEIQKLHRRMKEAYGLLVDEEI